MNERIKELVEQAFIITTDGKIGHVNTYMVEKFAELIVRECGNYMNSRVPGNIEISATVAKMKQHFGVEQ